jgi:hypothetical protein
MSVDETTTMASSEGENGFGAISPRTVVPVLTNNSGSGAATKGRTWIRLASRMYLEVELKFIFAKFRLNVGGKVGACHNFLLP